MDVAPTTPSARRVKVDSSPMSNSPLSYFSAKITAATSAAARAHPDEKTDVWELSIWDPKSLHLSLFSLFSPGHVLVYWLFLPTSSLDPRPSVTVVTTMLLAALLSAQLLLFKSFFEQKAKDEKILHKEVMNEYDTKYVHPSLNRPVRDVGTQSRESALSPGKKSSEVETYTPTTIVNRGFRINPNPSYAQHLGDNVDTSTLYSESPRYVDPRYSKARISSSLLSPTPMTRSSTTSSLLGGMGTSTQTSSSSTSMRDSAAGPDLGVYNLSPPKPLPRQSQYPPSARPTTERDRTSTFPRPGSDGGSLGVYSHAASPLRKSSSTNLLRGKSSRDFDARDSGRDRLGSPLKKVSTSSGLAYGASRTAERMGERSSRDDRSDREREKSADEGLRARLQGLRRESRPY